MRVKKESEKAGLKLNIQKTKIMASGPITSRQIDGEAMETVRDFMLGGGLQNHCSGDCCNEIKRCLLLGSMTNLDNVLKSRNFTFPTTQFRSINYSVLSFLYSPTYIHT